MGIKDKVNYVRIVLPTPSASPRGDVPNPTPNIS